VNFTGTSRVLHRHRPRSSPVNFTEFPRFHVPINNWISWSQINGCPVGFNCTNNQTRAFPYFEGGGRFLFGERVGLLVRFGYPYLPIGASFPL